MKTNGRRLILMPSDGSEGENTLFTSFQKLIRHLLMAMLRRTLVVMKEKFLSLNPLMKMEVVKVFLSLGRKKGEGITKSVSIMTSNTPTIQSTLPIHFHIHSAKFTTWSKS